MSDPTCPDQPGSDRFYCSEAPDRLIESLRSGRAIEQGQQLARRIGGLAAEHFENFVETTSRWRWSFREPVEDGEVESDKEAALGSTITGSLGTASASSSDDLHHVAQSDQGGEQITKYLFSDEGREKGIVKVYIEAKKLQVERFSEAHVSFSQNTLSASAVSHDGRVWVLHVNLYGHIKPAESKYTLSGSGHKVSVTLKKADADEVWHRLAAPEGGGSPSGAGRRQPGILHASDFV